MIYVGCLKSMLNSPDLKLDGFVGPVRQHRDWHALPPIVGRSPGKKMEQAHGGA
jgi:hypothetical protein